MMLQLKKRFTESLAIMAICLLSFFESGAQLLTPEVLPGKYLSLSEEQYAEGHYAVAISSLRDYLSGTSVNGFAPEGNNSSDKARYLLAMAGLKTSAPGCIDSALTEMNNTAQPAYKQRLSFTLAQYYFRENDLSRAIALYESTGKANLNEQEIAEEKFEMAYCYFNSKQFDKAEPLLSDIKDNKDSKYYLAGNYYYGLLVYNKNKYKEALQSFDRIKDAKEYKSVVPYYIAEILYFMGARDKALKVADTLLKQKEKSYYDKELHLLEAQCLFEEQRYKEALPYFDFYYGHTDKIRKQDLYEIAYCDYRTGAWGAATDKFKLLSSTSDSLGQTAMYLLGDCYLKKGDKTSARNAFGICADMSFNPGQQEASMILFARLSYEAGFNDDALRQLNALLSAFPGTQYKDEANTLISDLLVKTNKYAEALKHLKNVTRKDHTYRQIYQKATYGYAVQEFRKGELENALLHFNQSLEHTVNPEYEAATYFWKGEIDYRRRQYKETITDTKYFINSPASKSVIAGISPLATKQHACLNMGYAAMSLENFSDAQDYFNQAKEETGDAYSGMVAAVRQADAVFMQKNYGQAIKLYDKIIATDTADADYARYQKAILLGLQGKNNDKIALLQAIINGIPQSTYINHARYEIAISYLESDKYNQALSYLYVLTDSVADKSFAPQSLMKTGFVYQQMGKTDDAIAAYKRVVLDYPAAEDRLPALEALKSLYIQSNKPAEYSRLLKENNLPSADSSSVDSTYYAAAETQFASGKWDDAKEGFDNYLKEYPNGIFAVKALYYRAESNYQLNKYTDAMADYKIILSSQQCNEFRENSALKAARISFEAKNYSESYDFYLQLKTCSTSLQTKELAINGLMKSSFFAAKYPEALAFSDSVLAETDATAETTNDALFFKAKSLQQTDASDSAIVLYRQLSANKNGEIAAESRFHIAEILLKLRKFKDAEDAANESIHLSAGYDYWIVKSYLVLADLLTEQKDYFNARATLQSIVKHTKIDELKKEAIKKLDEVNELEKKQSKLSDEK